MTDERDERAAEEAGAAEIVESGDAPSPDDVARERDEARAQADQYLDDLRRLKAEFENYRKRIIKEQTALLERASEALIERMLDILDEFELALVAADRTKDYRPLVHGVEMVYGKLREVLRKEGLERIEALGAPFDPALHEAVMRTEGEGDLVVVDEMRPGYALGGRVLRPAMVKVGPRT